MVRRNRDGDENDRVGQGGAEYQLPSPAVADHVDDWAGRDDAVATRGIAGYAAPEAVGVDGAVPTIALPVPDASLPGADRNGSERRTLSPTRPSTAPACRPTQTSTRTPSPMRRPRR